MLSEHYPLKQGLKLLLIKTYNVLSYILSEHYPLKQGLKLTKKKTPKKGTHFLSEHYPLKQGLKLVRYSRLKPHENTFRTLSTKTRIFSDTCYLQACDANSLVELIPM